MNKALTLAAILVFALGIPAAAEKEQGSGSHTFTNTVKPFIEKYCGSCHGEEKQKANLRIDKLDPDL